MADRKQAIETLFRRYEGELTRLAVMLLHDEQDAQDVVQEVFARILDGDTTLTAATAKAYLTRSVRNRCLNAMRNRSIQQRASRLYLLDRDGLPADVGVPDEEQLAVLWQGVEGLMPPVLREVVVMHFSEGLKFREIAVRMQVSETTVYKYLRRAMQQLRQYLNTHYIL